MSESSTSPKERTSWLWFSIVIQQLVFAILAGDEIMLRHVAAWVSRVPIFIFWALYLGAPFTHLRPTSKKEWLRRYAIAGWLFVAGAIAWGICYWILCEKYGVPVSWDQVKDRYIRGAP